MKIKEAIEAVKMGLEEAKVVNEESEMINSVRIITGADGKCRVIMCISTPSGAVVTVDTEPKTVL